MLRALAFLTVVGRGAFPGPGVLQYFPAVGVLVGLAVGYGWAAAGLIWPPILAAAIAVALDAVITGLLHLDGLADSGDGLIAPMDRERRLTVMRDSSTGAFGAATLAIVLLVRFAAFAALPCSGTVGPAGMPARWGIPLAIAGLWCLSRTLMAATMARVPYARAEGGLASAFLGGRWRPTAIGGALAAVALAVVGAGLLGAVAALAAAVAGAAVVSFARARIGGFTGDVLGAAGVIAETVGLIALAALGGTG